MAPTRPRHRPALRPSTIAVVLPLWLWSPTSTLADDVPPSSPEVSAKRAVLIDVATGQVLYERRADEVCFPASLTKVMTVLLALETCDTDDEVVVSEAAAAVGEASAHLETGDRLRLRNLLLACVLRSANDATVAVGEHVSGSLDQFIDAMNARAAELGMKSTHFVNPNGLHDPAHVTTARDLAVVSRVALQRTDFRALAALPEAEMHYSREGVDGDQQRLFANTNRFLRPGHEHHWPLADGVKTGYTRQAGRCLIGSATQDGWQLLAVVLDCESGWVDARALIEWGFANYRSVRAVEAGSTPTRVHVMDGRRPTVSAVPRSTVSLVVPAGAAAPEPRVSEFYASAPISVGDPVGELVVAAADGTEVRTTLVAVEAISPSLRAALASHGGMLAAGVVLLALLGALVIHGAIAEGTRARRRRGPSEVRADHQGRPSDGRRKRRPPSWPPS